MPLAASLRDSGAGFDADVCMAGAGEPREASGSRVRV